MSPYPLDPWEATGPARLVVTALPAGPESERIVEEALARRLAACAQVGTVRSRYWWKGRLASAEERVVWFKTTPKRVAALFRFLGEAHPYEVPEILEIDVPRIHLPYLRYLAATVEPSAPPPPLGGGRAPPTRRRAGRRGRAARRPGRTRAPPRRP